MALQILKNNDFNLPWLVNGLSLLSSVANLTKTHVCDHGHVLSSECYAGAADAEDDDMPFAERFAALQAILYEQFAESERLMVDIREKLVRVDANG